MEVVYELHRTEIYEYEELSSESKEAVAAWMRDSGITNDDFQNTVDGELSLFGRFHDIKYQYSLGYCQGDGFNLYGEVSVENIQEFLRNWSGALQEIGAPVNLFEYSEKEWKRLKFYEYYMGSVSIPQNNWYSYCMSGYIDFVGDWVYDLKHSYWYANIDEELIYRYQFELKEFFQCLCRYFERLGYQMIYEPDEDWVAEMCDINEWRFTKEGKLV